MRYLLGAPLFVDAAKLFAEDVVGLGVTTGAFALPVVGIPYLPHVLGLEDRDLGRENADNSIYGRFQHNNDSAEMIADECCDDRASSQTPLTTSSTLVRPRTGRLLHYTADGRAVPMPRVEFKTLRVRHPARRPRLPHLSCRLGQINQQWKWIRVAVELLPRLARVCQYASGVRPPPPSIPTTTISGVQDTAATTWLPVTPPYSSPTIPFTATS
jgi:hypothetical protein